MSNQQKVITGATPFPNKPLFLAKNSINRDNVTGNGTLYTIIFDQVITNQGGVFDGISTFTPNVSGSYLLGFNVDLRELGATNTQGDLRIVTSNRNYFTQRANYGAMRENANILETGCSSLVDMEASDTATFAVRVSNGGADTVDVFGQVGNDFHTWCWGVFLG